MLQRDKLSNAPNGGTHAARRQTETFMTEKLRPLFPKRITSVTREELLGAESINSRVALNSSGVYALRLGDL